MGRSIVASFTQHHLDCEAKLRLDLCFFNGRRVLAVAVNACQLGRFTDGSLGLNFLDCSIHESVVPDSIPGVLRTVKGVQKTGKKRSVSCPVCGLDQGDGFLTDRASEITPILVKDLEFKRIVMGCE
jgi:hypothetical protein